jgi:hypothetical protein
MLCYVAIVVLISLFQLLFLRNDPWIIDLMKELLQFMMFVAIGWTFHLKDLNAYNMLDDSDSTLLEETGQSFVNLQSFN